jgi:hypothetical protein
VNEINPSIRGYTPLPHFSSSVIERHSRIPEIPGSTRFTKHVPIKIIRNIWPIDIRHRPQRPNHTPKATKLQSGCEMYDFIRGIVNVDRCTVTSGQERKFGVWESSLHQVRQCKPFVVVKSER